MDNITINKGSKYTDTCLNSVNILSNDLKMKMNSKRGRCSRVIILQKSRTGSYGFTLQTYAFKNFKTNRAELLTYMDYVEVGGPAFRAGMKRGDVILSINDRSIEGLQHEQLVQLIRQSPSPLRLTVTFEDWCTRIDLNIRKLKLKQHLKEKYIELALLEREEKEILRKAGLWKDDSEECCCNSDVSSSSVDQFSPSFAHKRTSFMCSSFSVLQDRSTRNRGYDDSGEAMQSRRDRLSDNRDRSYACHSLPMARKKKHFLQNQVFSVCENVVKMGCFSRSSANIDASSVDDVALVCDQEKSRTEDDPHLRGDCKMWYGVPKMHREALLKRQRKTSEVAKWYCPIFDDPNFQLGDESGFDSSINSTDDAQNSGPELSSSRPLESLSLFMPAEKSPHKVSSSSDFLENPSCDFLDEHLARSTRSSGEARSFCLESQDSSNPCSVAFEDLSFESQEFLNSLPLSSSSPVAPHDNRGPLRLVPGRSNLLTLYGKQCCDTHL